MDNHERQFGTKLDDTHEMREDRKVMIDNKMPETLQVNTYYAEESLHDRTDTKLNFTNNSADFNMPFEDEELLSGKVSPKSRGEKNVDEGVSLNNDNQYFSNKEGHKYQINSDLMAGGGKPNKTISPDGLFSDFDKLFFLVGVMAVVIIVEVIILLLLFL